MKSSFNSQKHIPSPKKYPNQYKSYIENFKMVSSKVSEKLNKMSPRVYGKKT